MPIQTDLNVAPYFDDFDPSKGFHRVVFQPNQAVQARELTQLQSILQNQIERFGDSIYNEGSIIKGCNFLYDNTVGYVKLRDLRVNLDNNTVSELVGMTAVDSVTGLRAIVIAADDGFETQNPNTKTIYVKYTTTGSGQKKVFAADDTLDFYDGDELQSALQVKVLPTTLDGSPTNPIGGAYTFGVTDGVIYQKGCFVGVNNPAIVVVSKYSSEPTDVVVGFETLESIVTEYQDPSLYDNAQGFSNENAPGAHRLKLTPTLKVYATADAPTSGFFVLSEWKNGQVIRENRTASYSGIGAELARRTAEESGDYVVNPFVITTSPIAGNTTHLSVDTTQGLAYVSGYRVEKLAGLSIPIRKGTDTAQLYAQQIVPAYGNYLLVQEMLGYFEPNTIQTVQLRDTALAPISGGTFTISAPGSQIGTARLIAVKMHDTTKVASQSDTRYRMYLTDIKMNSGKNFADVKAIYTTTGVADVVLENGKAVLKETSFQNLIFSFGQGSIKTLRNGIDNNNLFTYRTVNTTAKIQTTGTTGAITLSGNQRFPYGTGTLTEDAESKILVIPKNSATVTLAKSGNVSFSNNSNIVTGTSTAFLSEYQVGDIILVNSLGRQIATIANNTYLTTRTPFTGGAAANASHSKHYTANLPIPFVGRNSTITLSNNTSMSLTLKAANGATETLSANLDLAIYYDVQRTGAEQRNKQVLKSQYVKIDCSTNIGGTTGPWSLGLPDVYKIEAVYKDTGTYSEGAAYDVTKEFVLDTGQRDSFYGLAAIKRYPGTTLSLTSSDRLLVKVSVFRPDSGSGVGFFSVDSYPIDDANTANTTAITTKEIPIYTSPKTNQIWALRDSVDFRPIASNTAVYASNAASASINPSANVSYNASENYVVSPDESFYAGLEYYLPRIDKLVLDTSGNFSVVEGTPSTTLKPPMDVNGAMTLAQLTVMPYPSLSMKEALDSGRLNSMVSVTDRQIQRYTMKELHKIEQRVDYLEYYQSLSLLEKKTSELSVKDSAGLERFKNGISVDDFDDIGFADLGSLEFTATLDTKGSIVRAAVDQQTIELKVTATSNTYSSGEAVTLTYTDATLVEQLKSSRTRNLGDNQTWENTPPVVDIGPPQDPVYDEQQPPARSTPHGPFLSTVFNYSTGEITGYVLEDTMTGTREAYTPEQAAMLQGYGSNVDQFIQDNIEAQRAHLVSVGVKPAF